LEVVTHPAQIRDASCCRLLTVLTEEAAHELSFFVGLEWGDEDRQLMAPLVDAALVWAWPDTLARIAVPIVETLWDDELREDIERALDGAAASHERVAARVDEARADLALGPKRSRLARAVVEQGAFELAGDDLLPMHCLLCLEEGVARAPVDERRRRSLGVAQLACRVLDVPTSEVRAALATAAVRGTDVALVLATDDRRRVLREWLARLAELGAQSIPTVAEELRAAVRDPPGDVAGDAVWREAVRGLTQRLAADWN
jgi:hypothetical protein